MIPFLIMWIYSLSLFATTMFRTSIRDGIKFYGLCPRSQLMMFLESLYKLRIRESDQVTSVLELYDMEIHQKISMSNYQTLKTMVKRSQNQKLSVRNFDAGNKKIVTGAVVKSRRGLSGIERGKGICFHWKATGQCSRGDQCSFRHESHDRAKPTPEAAPSSEPTTPRGGSASRKRIRGRSPSGKTNRQTCRDFLKGTCTKLLCNCWHPPECHFFIG